MTGSCSSCGVDAARSDHAARVSEMLSQRLSERRAQQQATEQAAPVASPAPRAPPANGGGQIVDILA